MFSSLGGGELYYWQPETPGGEGQSWLPTENRDASPRDPLAELSQRYRVLPRDAPKAPSPSGSLGLVLSGALSCRDTGGEEVCEPDLKVTSTTYTTLNLTLMTTFQGDTNCLLP